MRKPLPARLEEVGTFLAIRFYFCLCFEPEINYIYYSMKYGGMQPQITLISNCSK